VNVAGEWSNVWNNIFTGCMVGLIGAGGDEWVHYSQFENNGIDYLNSSADPANLQRLARTR
jgi:hypothetical protein